MSSAEPDPIFPLSNMLIGEFAQSFPFVRVVLVYQSVQAIVFVAAAGRGTLVEIKVRV